MTKKTLKWRLSDLPTGDEVASLVEQKVITAEEARDILFNEEKEDTNQVAALKEEVKFLRELVDTLATKHNGWMTIYHEYRELKPRYPVWYNTYEPLMQTYSSKPFGPTFTTTTGAIGTVSSNTVNAVNLMSNSQQSMKGLSSLN